MHSSIWVLLSAQVFSILVGVVSYLKKSVSVSGLIALLAISSLFIWTDHIALLFVLFFMFASSSFLTKYKHAAKTEFDAIVAKTGPRDYVQALANLGVATFTLLLYLWFDENLLLVAFVSSVAAGNADSWASEIGGTSHSIPRLITTWKPVAKGVSGGVTMKGLAGGVAGSLFIVIVALCAMHLLEPFQGNVLLLFWISFASGIFGCLFDSYIGAWYQALYAHRNREQVSESPAGDKTLIKGVRWINNDMVNFLCTLAAAVSGGLFYYLLT